jgi:hypothetical protein
VLRRYVRIPLVRDKPRLALVRDIELTD